jgi:O-palmitoleoyl-L-serine hydrolase
MVFNQSCPGMSMLGMLCLLRLVRPTVSMLGDGSSPIRKVEAHPGDPATLVGYKLTDTSAVCLDGTPGMYYYRPGENHRKWFIYHQGGGWCDSLDDCLSRSQTDLGSSKNYPANFSQNDEFFSLDPEDNPLIHDWNMVYFMYCDGNSFSGSNSSTTQHGNATLHFRGKHILDAGLAQLPSLKHATDVVISGCSAGGLATFLHCDHYAEKLPHAKVVCVPQSGLFPDGPPNYHAGMTWAFHQQNASVNQDCLQSQVPQSNCNFAQYVMKYIRTPIFPLQSTYDTWQTANEIYSNDVDLINEWGKNLTLLVWTNLLLQHDKRHGIFLDSCSHHCGAWSIVIHGDTQATAMMKWYNQVGRRMWIQGKDYPCLECCGGQDKSRTVALLSLGIS